MGKRSHSAHVLLDSGSPKITERTTKGVFDGVLSDILFDRNNRITKINFTRDRSPRSKGPSPKKSVLVRFSSHGSLQSPIGDPLGKEGDGKT